MNCTQGFVYPATGELFRKEAAASIASLRKVMPHAHVTVVTDKKEPIAGADVCITIDNPAYSFQDKITALKLSPYERTVLIDTDTYIALPLDAMFGMLDQADIAAACELCNITGEFVKLPSFEQTRVPETVPEWNAGVLCIRKTEATDRFINEWERIFHEHGAYGVKNDQFAFRQAVYESPNVRMLTMTVSFNFHAMWTTVLHEPVHLLHAHAWDLPKSAEKIAAAINSASGLRIYVPGLGVLRKPTAGPFAWINKVRHAVFSRRRTRTLQSAAVTSSAN